MLTLQSNNEIRINKGDSGMTPLFINIGDNLRPIGYNFNAPIVVTSNPELNIVFYEDIWRDKVLESGEYVFTYSNNEWTLSGEEVVLIDYGIEIKGTHKTYQEGQTITINFALIDNNSEIYFQMWPILQNPETPLLEKVIIPKENKIVTFVSGEKISEAHTNTVDSYGRILLYFYPEDTLSIDRGKYLYQLRCNLYNKYTDEYDLKTMINRTPFYVIDDNFTQRVW